MRYKALVNSMSSRAREALAQFLFEMHDIDTDLSADLWKYSSIINHKVLKSALNQATAIL